MDEARSPPALTGLTVTPVAGSTDKLDVSWNAWTPKPEIYQVRWKTSGQSYVSTRQITVQNTPTQNKTGTQITGLTANTEYDIRVTALSNTFATLARSETTATTNATTVDYMPTMSSSTPNPASEGTTVVFGLVMRDRNDSNDADPGARGRV